MTDVTRISAFCRHDRQCSSSPLICYGMRSKSNSRSATRKLCATYWKQLIHLVENARLLPGHISKITSLLRRKSGRKPVPFLFSLLQPEYRVENFPIAAARPTAGRSKVGKETLDARPVVVGKRDL
jgi:hypothetical protein